MVTKSSTNTDLNNLSTNSWQSTAKTSLAVLDAYTGVNGKSVLTSVTNLLAQAELSFADVLRGGEFIAANLPSLSSLISPGALLWDAKSLTARILAASPVTTAMLSKLSAAATEGITDAVQDTGTVLAAIGSVVQTVASASISDIQAVGTMLGALTQNPAFLTVTDAAATTGLYVGLMSDAMSYGVPNSYGGLMGALTGQNNLINQITKAVLPSITSSSDYSSLASVGAQLGDQGAYTMNPDVLSDFSSNYTNPPNTDSSQSSALFGSVMDAYDSVDSTWSVGSRGTSAAPSTTLDLTPIMGGSGDFNNMITQGAQSSSDDSLQLYSLAPVFTPTTVQASLQQTFPQTAFSGNSTTTGIVQPGLIGSNPSLAQTGSQQSSSLPLWNSSWGPYNGDPNFQPAPATPAGANANSHVLLGYYADGTAKYSDDDYTLSQPFFPLGTK